VRRDFLSETMCDGSTSCAQLFVFCHRAPVDEQLFSHRQPGDETPRNPASVWALPVGDVVNKIDRGSKIAVRDKATGDG